MKKYLSLFIVFMLAFVANIGILEAKEGTSGSDDDSVSTTTTFKLKDDNLTPAQKAERERMREEARKKMEAERLKIKETRGEIKDTREDFREGMKEKRGEIKDEREDMRKNARMFIAANLLRRAENLAQISARIKTRIEKLKANGIDTAAALALVVKADGQIDIAKTNAAKAKTDIEAGATLEVIRADVQASREALRQAHDYLEQAIKDLRSKMGDKEKVKVETHTNVEDEGGVSL